MQHRTLSGFTSWGVIRTDQASLGCRFLDMHQTAAHTSLHALEEPAWLNALLSPTCVQAARCVLGNRPEYLAAFSSHVT